MKNLFVLTVLMMLTACGSSTSVEEDPLDITSKFNNTNNIYESFEKAEDGTITYNAVRWGGLQLSFLSRRLYQPRLCFQKG